MISKGGYSNMKSKTIYIAIAEANDWESFYDDQFVKRFVFQGRYPKEVVNKIPKKLFKELNWDLGVVTFSGE